jgi:hypothetical protein
LTYAQLYCATNTTEANDASQPLWKKRPFAAAFGQHGIHFFVTHDSDNATLGVPVDEVDGQQWRYSVPMRAPGNVIQQYAPNVLTPLQPVVTPFL